MNTRGALPAGVRAARAIALVQGALGTLTGLFFVFGGAAVARASGLTVPAAGALVIGLGVVLLAVSGLLIWGGLLLGALSPRARLGVLVYEWLSLLLGILGLTNPGLGLVGTVLAGVSVYFLQFDARTRTAFRGGDRLSDAAASPPPR